MGWVQDGDDGHEVPDENIVMDWWRPIETAPKDGTTILLAVPGWKLAVTGYWWDHQTITNGKVVSHTQKWSYGSLYANNDVDPTHWMPLPELPLDKSPEKRDV